MLRTLWGRLHLHSFAIQDTVVFISVCQVMVGPFLSKIWFLFRFVRYKTIYYTTICTFILHFLLDQGLLIRWYERKLIDCTSHVEKNATVFCVTTIGTKRVLEYTIRCFLLMHNRNFLKHFSIFMALLLDRYLCRLNVLQSYEIQLVYPKNLKAENTQILFEAQKKSNFFGQYDGLVWQRSFLHTVNCKLSVNGCFV